MTKRRGSPRSVAQIALGPRKSDADVLLLTGQLSPSAGDLLALGAPLKPRPGVRLPSTELAAMREDER